MQIRTKESRKRLQSLILLTAFTCVLLIVSTYAWFTVQKDVTISNIRGKVEVAEGLQVSFDAKRWAQEIDLESTDALTKASLTKTPGTDGVVYGPYTGHRNHVPAEFIPVSASGELTDDSKNLSMVSGTYADKKITSVAQCDESETSATAAKYAGYYAFDMFLMNSSKTGTTSDILQLNSDAFAWVLPEGQSIIDESTGYEYVGNPDSGLQNTIRVAFARYGAGSGSTGIIPATDEPDEIITAANAQTISAVSIWEPNSDTHTNYILNNVKPLFDVSYPSHTMLGATSGDQFFTKAIKKGVASIDDVYNWGDASLAEPKTVQTTARSATGTIDPYIEGGVKNLTDINGDDFTLAPNSVTKVRVYIYMEGQDPDCDNIASQGGGIEVNIGLTKTEDEGDEDRYNEVIAAVTP